jgi:imidazole glycerol-phosphate synthase subunit HisH
MLKRVGSHAFISSNPDDILKADKLILPGVGSFDHAAKQLSILNLIDLLNEKVLHQQIPILGICLGAQLMTKSSEEGNCQGLGWMDFGTIAFDKSKLDAGTRIPHMGWESLENSSHSRLLNNFDETPRFYFLHSFHFELEDSKFFSAFADYGYRFPAAFEKDNIYGVQFHPEKSGLFGMNFMKNFVNL